MSKDTQFYKKKKIIGKAMLKNKYSAIFHDAYHYNDIDNDHIYKSFKNISEKHMIDNNVLITDFKFPYEDNYFKFKDSDKIICKDLDGKPCMLEDCYGKKVTIGLDITPYDFVSKGSRIVGISLKVTSIKLCK